MNCNPPGSSVHGIFQVRILERVAISFSRWPSRPRDLTCVSCIGGFFTTEPPGKPTSCIVEYYSIIWIYYILFTHSPIDGYLSCSVWGYWESSRHKHWQFFSFMNRCFHFSCIGNYETNSWVVRYVQLTLEQHRLELPESTSMQIFSLTNITVL